MMPIQKKSIPEGGGEHHFGGRRCRRLASRSTLAGSGRGKGPFEIHPPPLLKKTVDGQVAIVWRGGLRRLVKNRFGSLWCTECAKFFSIFFGRYVELKLIYEHYALLHLQQLFASFPCAFIVQDGGDSEILAVGEKLRGDKNRFGISVLFRGHASSKIISHTVGNRGPRRRESSLCGGLLRHNMNDGDT